MFWALLVVGLVNAACLVYGGRWFVMYAGQRWDRRLDLDERVIALQETRGRSSVPPAMPPELVRRIMQWQDVSAQESERSVILGLYDEFRDVPDPWSKVKAHLAPMPADDLSSALLS